MGAAEKTDEAVVFARFKDPANYRGLYRLAADSGQPVSKIVEMMVAYCLGAKGFKVPSRGAATADKLIESRKRRTERYRKVAGGE